MSFWNPAWNLVLVNVFFLPCKDNAMVLYHRSVFFSGIGMHLQCFQNAGTFTVWLYILRIWTVFVAWKSCISIPSISIDLFLPSALRAAFILGSKIPGPSLKDHLLSRDLSFLHLFCRFLQNIVPLLYSDQMLLPIDFSDLMEEISFTLKNKLSSFPLQ